MPADLEQLFDSVRRDAMSRPLAEPQAVRKAAERRTRGRQAVTACTAALLLAGGLGTVATLLQPGAAPRPGLGAPGPTSPAPSSAGPSAGGTTPEPPPVLPPPSAPAGSHPCRAADLDPQPAYDSHTDSGQLYQTVMIRNASASACILTRVPSLGYTDPKQGFVRLVYTLHPDPGLAAMSLRPGGTAALTFRTTNGYGGQDPGSPDCQHPMRYTGIAVVLTDGSRFPLPGFEIKVTCGVVTVQLWFAGR
jgi:hypothetical protein